MNRKKKNHTRSIGIKALNLPSLTTVTGIGIESFFLNLFGPNFFNKARASSDFNPTSSPATSIATVSAEKALRFDGVQTASQEP